jgi:hypothetical protein
MRNFLTWVIVFAVGLLIGFVPQYWKARGAREELTSCHTRADLAKVQQSAALTYVAATQLNYGLASGYAQTFFANAQSVQATTPDAAIKDALTQVLAASTNSQTRASRPVTAMINSAERRESYLLPAKGGRAAVGRRIPWGTPNAIQSPG